MREKLDGLRLFLRSAAGIEALACGLFVGLGWLLRTRGVLWGGRFGLWSDEATWAMRLLERPLSEHLIRPPLFMWLTRVSVAILGNTEFAFRLLPWLAGMASPIVAIHLGRVTLRTAGARVLLVAVIALSEGSIDFSKEFKPYGVAIFLHLLLPYLVLRWVASRTRKDLLWACAALPLGVLFCQDVLFLYPGLFLVMAIEAFRTRSLKQLYIVLGFGAVTAAFVAGMYLEFWRRIPKDRAEEYWGDKYGVFFRPKTPSDTYRDWLTPRYLAVVDLPNQRSGGWSNQLIKGRAFRDIRELNDDVWLALHFAGIAVCVLRRRWKEGLCFWSPLLVCVLFNRLGFWPFGAFRTNQFLIAETSVLAAVGLDWPKPSDARWRMLLPACLLMVLPLVFFERSWASTKRLSYATGMMDILKQLEAWQAEARPSSTKENLYLDHHSCQPFSFYVKYHPRGVRLWNRLSQHMDYRCDENFGRTLKRMRQLPHGVRFWVMAARPTTRRRWPKDFRMDRRFSRPPHELFETHAP
jgi:hypothetical protein